MVVQLLLASLLPYNVLSEFVIIMKSYDILWKTLYI